MASPEDIKQFARKQGSPDNTAQTIQKFPPFPEDVKTRFPTMRKMEDDIEQWRVKTNIALRGGTEAG